MKDIMPITMESETLYALKADMDSIIGKTIGNMKQTESDDATISIKIRVTFEKRAVPDGDGVRNATVPKFEHDVQSIVQIKDKKSGSMSGDRELVYDPETGKWYLKDILGQVSMFDEDLNGEAPIATDANGNQLCINGDDVIEASEAGIDEAPEADSPEDEAPEDVADDASVPGDSIDEEYPLFDNGDDVDLMEASGK